MIAERFGNRYLHSGLKQVLDVLEDAAREENWELGFNVCAGGRFANWPGKICAFLARVAAPVLHFVAFTVRIPVEFVFQNRLALCSDCGTKVASCPVLFVKEPHKPTANA